MTKLIPKTLLLSAFICLTYATYAQTLPLPDHIVIIIEENHAVPSVIGNAAAPYINMLANDSNSALFTQMFAITHPSQPNYLNFFSGSAQGVIDDNVPTGIPYTTPNLARELLDNSRSFATYSQDLPSVGYNGASSGSYGRKHNPVTNWTGTGTNQVPDTLNQPLSAFPTDFAMLPTVSYVVPNMDSDMHNGGTGNGPVAAADLWFSEHLDAYRQWALTHNSLLIFTFDEDDYSGNNKIPTFFYGPMVKGGTDTSTFNLYNMLRTIEDIYSLGHAGAAATAAPILNCWKTLTAINDVNSTSSALKVYPNPSSSILHIDDNTAENISITDVTGRLIEVQNILGHEHLELNTSSYPDGLYFYSTSLKGAMMQSGKFTIMHQ